MATEADFRGHAGREFFTTRTVAEALTGFRPARRTAAQAIPLSEALHRVPAAPVTAPHPLPGFARFDRGRLRGARRGHLRRV